MSSLIYKDECFNITGAVMAVHSWLGTGFLEEVYQEALEIEFKKRNIPYEREKVLKIDYRGIILNKYYKADFICYNKILIELKTVNKILPEHEAQVIKYLKATGLKLGLLFNFREESIYPHRYVL